MAKRFAVTVVLLLALSLAGVAPASANTLHPTGCDPWGYGGWTNNCWLGNDASRWVRSADYVVGAQRIISGTTNVGTIDGIYGHQTTQAMRTFQQQLGLSADGIVGSQTWGALRGRLIHRTTAGSFRYYDIAYVAGTYFAQRTTSPHDWWVVRRSGSGYVRFTVNGPS